MTIDLIYRDMLCGYYYYYHHPWHPRHRHHHYKPVKWPDPFGLSVVLNAHYYYN